MGMDLSGWNPRLDEAEAELEQGIQLGFGGADGRDALRRAERISTEVLEAQPGDTRALLVRARACFCLGYEAGRFSEDSLPFLRQAAKDLLEIPSCQDLVLERAWTFLMCLVPLAEAGEEIESWANRARECVNRLVELNPNDPDALRARAELSCALGDVADIQGDDPLPLYDRALREFRAVGEAGGDVDDELGRVEVRRGELLGRRGLDPVPAFRRALRFFARASREFDDDPSHALHAGQTFLLLAASLKDAAARAARKRAIGCFEEALKKDPHCVSALLGRAQAYLRRSEGSPPRQSLRFLVSAQADLEMARSIAPDSAEVHAEAGLVGLLKLCALTRLDSDVTDDVCATALTAMRSLDRALALDPANMSAHEYRARLRLTLWSSGLSNLFPGELLGGVIADASEAIRSEPLRVKALNCRAAARMYRAVDLAPRERLDELLRAESDVELILWHWPEDSIASSLKSRILLHRAQVEVQLGIPSLHTIRRALDANTRSGEEALAPGERELLRRLARSLSSVGLGKRGVNEGSSC